MDKGIDMLAQENRRLTRDNERLAECLDASEKRACNAERGRRRAVKWQVVYFIQTVFVMLFSFYVRHAADRDVAAAHRLAAEWQARADAAETSKMSVTVPCDDHNRGTLQTAWNPPAWATRVWVCTGRGWRPVNDATMSDTIDWMQLALRAQGSLVDCVGELGKQVVRGMTPMFSGTTDTGCYYAGPGKIVCVPSVSP